MSAFVIRVVLDRCREEGIDERSLSKSRLASNLRQHEPSSCRSFESPNIAYHNCEGCSSLRDNLVSLVWKIGNANWGRTLDRAWSHCEMIYVVEPDFTITVFRGVYSYANYCRCG
jgi:hypothetical protein